jgi:hypothetical protein
MKERNTSAFDAVDGSCVPWIGGPLRHLGAPNHEAQIRFGNGL